MESTNNGQEAELDQLVTRFAELLLDMWLEERRMKSNDKHGEDKD